MEKTIGIALALGVLALSLQGCSVEKVSPACRSQCANLPASSFGEVRACEQQCMNPDSIVEVHEKLNVDITDGPESIF